MPFPHVVNVTTVIAFGCLMLVAVNNKCKQQEAEVNEAKRASKSQSTTQEEEGSESRPLSCPHGSAQCGSDDAVKLCPFLAARAATQQTLSVGQRAVTCAVKNPALAGLAVGSLTLGTVLTIFYKVDQQ